MAASWAGLHGAEPPLHPTESDWLAMMTLPAPLASVRLPVASGVGRGVVPPAPADCCTR
jgi:hypothetical protein